MSPALLMNGTPPLISVPGASPPIETYAAAARALTTSTYPVSTRLAVVETLLRCAPSLVPHPGPLLASHAAYALCNPADDVDPFVRACYWRVLSRVSLERTRTKGLGEAAIRALRGGDSQEVTAVMGLLEGESGFSGDVEARADLAGAVFLVLKEDSGRKWVHVGRKVLEEWKGAQARCGNAKRLAQAVEKYVLPVMVDGGWNSERDELWKDMWEVALKGLFASPAAALERGGYYSGLYAWLKEPEVRPSLPHVCRELLKGFVGQARSEDVGVADGRITDWKKKRKRGAEGGVAQDDGVGVLPREILVPLIFFKDLLRTACELTKVSLLSDDNSSYAPLCAIGELFSFASTAGIYRPSYDERPAVRAKRKLAAGESPGSVGFENLRPESTHKAKSNSHESSTGKPGLPEFGEELCVGEDIVSGFDAAVLALEHGSREGNTIAIDGACATIIAAVTLTLDTVAPKMSLVLHAVALLSTGAEEEVVASASKLVATILTTYASTRQLPEAAKALRACGGGLGPVLSSIAVRSAVANAVSLAPRGHPEAVLRCLLSEKGPTLGSEGLEPFVLFSCVVIESAQVGELDGLSKALADVVMPAILGCNEGSDSSVSLMHVRTSVVYAMAATGTPITSSLFRRVLFAPIGTVDDDESCPDSDSSDYDAFMENKRRKESPRARFAELLSFGVQWKVGRKSSKAASSSSSKKRKRSIKSLPSLPMDQTLLYLRYLASLAHVCASDQYLSLHSAESNRAKTSGTSPSSDRTPCAEEESDSTRCGVSPLDLSLQECWTLYHALDKSGASLDLVKIGGSLMRLVRSGRVVGRGKCDEDPVALGFERFVGLALDSDSSVDTLWGELRECQAVQYVFAKVIESSISTDISRLSLSRILNRCALMPPRYLCDSEDLELVACCAKVIECNSSDDAASQALRVLAQRRELPVTAGEHRGSPFVDVIETPLVNNVRGGGEAGEAFVAALLRGNAWRCDDGYRKVRAKLVARIAERASSSLNRITWFLRGAKLAFEEQELSSAITASGLVSKLAVVLESIPAMVEEQSTTASPVNLLSDLACALCELCVIIRNLNDRVGASAQVSLDIMGLLKSATFVSTQMLHHSSTSSPSPVFAVTKFLVTFVKGGSRSACFIILPSEIAEATVLRLATLCIDWLRSDSADVIHGGEILLSSLVNGEGSRLQATALVIEYVLSQFEGNIYSPSIVKAARILLCARAGNASLVTSSLSHTIDFLRCESSICGNARATLSASVHEAVMGAEAWTRAQTSRSGKWEAELILQLLCQLCYSSKMFLDSAVVVLRICHVTIKQATRSASAGSTTPSTSPGILWGIQRIVAALLQDPSRLDVAVMTEASRVQEAVASVSATTRSRSGSHSPPPVVVHMTADLAACLSGVSSAVVRGAASAGMGCLLGACGGDAVAAMAMTMLKSDAAKDVLRAVRAEVVEDGAVYRGRS